MNASLFELGSPAPLSKDILGAGTAFLAGFALDTQDELLLSLKCIAERSPFRNMVTPGGYRMSVAMTNCGPLGWVTDRSGYRYDAIDPEMNRPWPMMPLPFRELAVAAGEEAGFSNFVPDACLINRYEPGARLSLHHRDVPFRWVGARGKNSTHPDRTWRCNRLGRSCEIALPRHRSVARRRTFEDRACTLQSHISESRMNRLNLRHGLA
jgi:alkylated DNA repair dioxygenase AlkB